MGSLPELSVVKGRRKNLEKRKLHQMFEEYVKKSEKPQEEIAIIFEENSATKTISYEDVNIKSNQLARSLLKEIIENRIEVNNDGDYIVAVSMLPSDRLLLTLLAIWKSGAAYLPIDPTFPEQRIRHILKESKPVLVIYDESAQIEFFEGTRSISISKLASQSDGSSTENIPEINCLTQTTENLAIVLYTSGSTGVPKGVRLPHEVILNRLQWQFDEFPYSDTEKVCVFKTALTFVDSVCEIWGPLLNGLALLVIPKNITRDPQKLAEELTKYKVERLVLVPSLLRSLLMYLSLNDDKSSLNDLKLWISSGETLTVALSKSFFDHFKSGNVLCNFYGSTEVMGDVTYCTLTGMDSLKDLEKIPIGNPVDNTIIYLLDENLQPVPQGYPGELWVSGCNLAAGYVNGRDPDKFVLNPLAQNSAYSKLYRTGDFAKYEKGTIFYEGRTDSQIKIRGHRVDLSEVEKAVVAVNGIEKGVVLCYKPGEIDQALLAFVTPHAGKNLSGMQVEKCLQEKLASYMVPQVVVLDNIPLLVNGKVDRQSLLKTYENANNNDDASIIIDIDYSGVPPYKLQAAEALFKTVGSVIGRSTRDTLSLKSNYYALGGNSLNSIFTISQLKERGYIIGITDFITAKNLEEVLDKITSTSKIYDLVPSTNVTGFKSELLEDMHKDICLKIIVSSFYEKAELEQFLKSEIKPEDYYILLETAWNDIKNRKLSFVVKNQEDKIVAVSLNMDVRDEMEEADLESGLTLIFEFLEYVEGPIREKHFPKEKGHIMHSFMMATAIELSTQENITLIQFMEEENMRLAKSRGYEGVFTTNTSPLTQQLGTDVLGYETLLDYKIKEYVSPSGRAPFSTADDDLRAVVCWKRI